MDYPYRLPGTSGPEMVIQTSAFGARVLVDGVRIPGRGMFRRTFPIRLPDGSVRELTLSDGPGGLRATVDGVATQIGPGTLGTGSSWLDLVIALLPLVVIVRGGLLGGLIGGLACGINFGISRTRAGRPIKWLAMIGVTVFAVVVYLGAGLAVRSAISPAAPAHPLGLASGTCLNGLRPGGTIATEALRPVDCAGSHDNEIIGGSPGPAGGTYPGQDGLRDFATTLCLSAFRTYVGIDLGASHLDVLPPVPTETMWSHGDRDVSCVVITRNGSKLAGSVRGTRQ